MSYWIHYEWGRFPDGRTGWHCEIKWPAMAALALCAVAVLVHC